MFICHQRDNSPTAFRYLCGLLQSGTANMEQMAEVVEDANYESLQHFISNSPWSAREVCDRVAGEADKLLGGTGETALLIGKAVFPKKGDSSVGVAYQSTGHWYEYRKCQLAVFGALAAGERTTPIDVALFLPREWTSSAERCAKAGVPVDERVYRTEAELALQIVRHQRELGLRFDYVCLDSSYERDSLLTMLDDDWEVFLLQIPEDSLVCLELVDPVLEPRATRTEPGPRRRRRRGREVPAGDLSAQLGPHEWEHVVFRRTATGQLSGDIHRRRVWTPDAQWRLREWQLVIWRECSTPPMLKYFLTNASTYTDAMSLARMAAPEFSIARVLEDARSEAGLADYQVRGWLAWHHHMALVLVARLLTMRSQMLMHTMVPRLSRRDIRGLLAHFLPRGEIRCNTTIE